MSNDEKFIVGLYPHKEDGIAFLADRLGTDPDIDHTAEKAMSNLHEELITQTGVGKENRHNFTMSEARWSEIIVDIAERILAATIPNIQIQLLARDSEHMHPDHIRLSNGITEYLLKATSLEKNEYGPPSSQTLFEVMIGNYPK